MAKKQQPDLSNIFAKTEQAAPAPDDPVRPVGIGLKISEWGELEKIAAELGVTRHQLTMWILRDFTKRWRDGYRPQTETKKVLKT